MKKIILLSLLAASCTTEKKPSVDPLPASDPMEAQTPQESQSVAVVNFDFDKYVLVKVEKQKILDQVWKLRKPSTPVKIIGYTDSQGSKEYNQTLSEKRAKAVAAFLLGQGINSKWLEAEGKGASNLLNPDKTKGEHFANRRVEITYTVK